MVEKDDTVNTTPYTVYMIYTHNGYARY